MAAHTAANLKPPKILKGMFLNMKLTKEQRNQIYQECHYIPIEFLGKMMLAVEKVLEEIEDV